MVTKWNLGNYRVLYHLFINFILALISMNIRILSGILFLIASIITLPLVLLFITLIIPIFFITAIMMFARRSKLETVPAYGSTYDYPLIIIKEMIMMIDIIMKKNLLNIMMKKST